MVAGTRAESRERTDVFVLDDDDALREVIVYALADQGYRAVGVQPGPGAFSELSRVAPRLILLDWVMPTMSGGDFRSAQLDQFDLADIPAVLMSGWDAEIPDLAHFSGFLRKPFSLEDLFAVVAQFCGPRAPNDVGPSVALCL